MAIDPRPVVVFLGDSLTAGFGLSEEQAYPALIATRLAAEGRDVRVVNAGLSGDTTAGGLRRLDWLLSQEPDVVMVALGGNDGLRALALESTEANLRAIIEQSREVGAVVVLAGMLIPPNYGPEYTEAFAAIYPRLADEYEVVFIPFLLEGVAADPELNLPDGIHPNVAGQKILAETVYPVIESALSGNG
ncbi:MAG: arylesterase [Acidobacteriota bacterium]